MFEFKIFAILLLAAIALMVTMCSNQPSPDSQPSSELRKLEYNNPEILVDLDAGFKAVPMPLDFDSDGDYDLLISESSCYAESGVFYFENLSGNVEMPIFRQAMRVSSARFRLGYDGSCFDVSRVNGHVHVLTPDRVREQLLIYKDVPQNVFWDKNEVTLPTEGYAVLHFYKNTQWKLLDFDGDSLVDLVCSAQTPQLADLRGIGAAAREQAYAAYKKENQLFYLKNTGSNAQPVYCKPEKIIKQNGESLAQGLALKPLFADYDNDGDLDFISIRSADDCFLYFENTGTQSCYRFAEGQVLQHNGAPIQMVSLATIHSTAIDWDKDGWVDLIAGDEDGKISLLKNSGKPAEGVPQFLPPRFFQQKARFVDCGALAATRVFDWDGDGLDDILYGNGVGQIGFIKNLGGKNPKWAAPVLLQANSKDIRVLPPGATWGYTTIDAGDWNHDDLPDILANHHHGNLLWYENIGSRKSPKLTAAQPVEVAWQGTPLKPQWIPGKACGNELLAPWRTSPMIMDFNNDQLNDLVMLDHEGYLAVYVRFRDGKGALRLAPPQRNFVYPSGEPILLNQRTGSSSGRLKITFADWDGDGLRDLVFSSKPAMDWMKNVGEKDGKIVLQYMGRVISQTLMGHTDGPVVADWNRDGVPDLLVGAENGLLYYWERPGFHITSTMTSTEPQAAANYPYFKR
ncbi:VCBS repeat-containing protein [candidate division KSB1 bacterium]|nr:VCBS repeat-containing protein [candidate division KSB1 bacterium]